MKYRIALWAVTGFIVAACWAIYALPVMAWDDRLMLLAEITCPITVLRAYPLHLSLVLAANATTYAMVGFLVETVRRRFRHAE
jgi:hypothetical protein